jgi:hypothetical protein
LIEAFTPRLGSEEQIFRDREKERANGKNQTKFHKLKTSLGKNFRSYG